MTRYMFTHCHDPCRCNPTAISLKAGCELFLRYTTRTSALEIDDFHKAKKRLIERGQHFSGAPGVGLWHVIGCA